ncbi:MAG: pilus assembly protein [Alkalimonas sp.]|nr:pilus assembly protein [Alkalimonas sp.]
MIEFNIALPFLAPVVLLGIMVVIQWGFIYVAKSTLDSATMQATRTGSLHHGGVREMRESLAHGMMPLYAKGTGNVDIIRALNRSAMEAALLSNITILNPDINVFNAFRQRVIYDGSEIFEIPNNNLMYRNPTILTLGDGRPMNIQDANLLHVEIRWCHRLIVPFANRLISAVTSSFTSPSTHQLQCNAIGMADGNIYLALVSEATMRMNTPFRM